MTSIDQKPCRRALAQALMYCDSVGAETEHVGYPFLRARKLPLGRCLFPFSKKVISLITGVAVDAKMREVFNHVRA